MHVPGEIFAEEMGLFHYLLCWRYFVWRKFKLTTGKEKNPTVLHRGTKGNKRRQIM